RKPQRAHLSSKKFHGVIATLSELLCGRDHAYAQEVRYGVTTGDQKMDILRCNRLIFVRYDRGVDNSADKRLVTIIVAADCGEFHLGIGNADFRQRGPPQHIGHGIWRRYRDLLAPQILNFRNFVVRINSMRYDNPVTAEQLDIAALGIRCEDPLRSTLETVKLAGNQRLQGKLIVLELRNFYFESLFFCKVTRRHHQENTGIGLGVDEAVLPNFLLSAGLRRENSSKHSDHASNGGLPAWVAHCEVPP